MKYSWEFYREADSILNKFNDGILTKDEANKEIIKINEEAKLANLKVWIANIDQLIEESEEDDSYNSYEDENSYEEN